MVIKSVLGVMRPFCILNVVTVTSIYDVLKFTGLEFTRTVGMRVSRASREVDMGVIV